MSQPADPISSPEAYRASLLAALGDDDPAIAQAETPAAIRALILGAGERVRSRPAPDEWSALECIGHIFDSELIVSARARWILAEDEPDIVGYDQALWVAELRHTRTTRPCCSPRSRPFAGPTWTCGHGARSRTVSASGATGNVDRRATT